MKRQEKKMATRAKLLASAWQLFAEQGYDTTTVQQITDHSGVAKGTFFNYFHSKEEVLCDLQLFWTQEEIAKLLNKEGPLIPRLKVMLTDLTRRVPFTRSLALACIQGMTANPELLQRQKEELQQVIDALVPVVRLGQERGELHPALSPLAVADNALRYYFGVLLTWGMGVGEEDLAEQMALSFEGFFNGIMNK